MGITLSAKPPWSHRSSRRQFLRSSLWGMAAVAGAGTFSQPADRVSAADNTLEILWQSGHKYDTYAEVIDNLKTSNPQVTVQWSVMQWPDIRRRLLAGFTAGNPPSVSEVNPDWVAEFAQKGLLEPLTSYISRDGSSMGFPSDWDEEALIPARINGTYYAVPLHYTCALLFYNKTLLDKAGFPNPPKTWDDFLQVAKAVTTKDVWGYAPNSDEELALWPWFTQNGVRYYDPKTNRVGLDTPEAIEAVQFNVDLVYKHNVAPAPAIAGSVQSVDKMFTTGRVAMMYTGPWDVHPVQAANPAFEWRIGPATRKKVQATWSTGAWLIIPKAGKNKELAWDFIKRITSLETEVKTTLKNGMTMPRKSWAHHPDIQKDTVVAPFGTALASYAINYNKLIGFTGKTAQIDNLLQAAWESAIYRKATPADALRELGQKANQILASK
jgi:multiple sugar transport system substrate-binding protein